MVSVFFLLNENMNNNKNDKELKSLIKKMTHGTVAAAAGIGGYLYGRNKFNSKENAEAAIFARKFSGGPKEYEDQKLMHAYELALKNAARKHFEKTGHTAEDEHDADHLKSWMNIDNIKQAALNNYADL